MSQIFILLVGGIAITIFTIYYILKKINKKKKRSFIALILVVCFILWIGKSEFNNPNSAIYNNTVITNIDKKIRANNSLIDKFGQDVDLSFIYKIVINLIIGAVVIGIATGSKDDEGGDANDSQKE